MSLNNLAAGFALLLALTGCTAIPRAPVVEQLLPPVNLIQDCVMPEYRTVTNADIANAVRVLRSGLELCNNDKAALRAWAERKE